MVTKVELVVYKSVMANKTITSNSIFSASERELVTLSMSEIIDGLLLDYKSFSHGVQAGISVPDNLQEPRVSHSCILYAEGLRLARTHQEQARKLILASLFESNAKATDWFAEEDTTDDVEATLMKAEAGQRLTSEDDLLLFCTFGFHARAVKWLAANGGMNLLTTVFKEIKDFEAYKTAARIKNEKEE